MEGEFNNLAINNAPITFTNNTNNIATSDELSAPLLYQDTLGTKHSRAAKKVTKAAIATGIALLVTTAAIKTGSIVSNAFVLNAPTVTESSFAFEEGVFHYSFIIANKGNYQIKYYISINDEVKFSAECSEETTYSGSYDEIEPGERGSFYVEFTNGVDYKKRIKTVRFTTKGINL